MRRVLELLERARRWLNDVKGRILEVGVSERNGDAGIKLYAGTAAARARDSEYPIKCMAGGSGRRANMFLISGSECDACGTFR